MVPEPHGTGHGPDDHLSLVFGALAHPARRQMLARLGRGDASIAELAAPFHFTARAASKHVQVLERAGLVSRGRDAQRRPSHLITSGLRDAYDWLGEYRALWEQRFGLIDELLAQEKQRELRDANTPRRPKRQG